MTDRSIAPQTAAAITGWLRTHLAPLLRCAPEDIDATARFETLGLDSATAVRVTMDLEDWLGRSVDPTMLYDYPTIEALADALARGEGGSAEGSARPSAPSDGSQ